MAARPAGAPRRWSDVERRARQAHGPLLAGVDEVGRGPLAGPVVACAVVMPADARKIVGVDDSKRLAAEERARLAVLVRRHALGVAVGAASVREVDALNVFHATVLAMRRALARLDRVLGAPPDHCLVDGIPLRTLGRAHTAVVGGDARCYAIACASIVAKVTRDRLMRALAARHAAYGWERNVGYGTAAHRAALAAHGLTAHHRRSFCERDQLELALVADASDEDVREEGMVEGMKGDESGMKSGGAGRRSSAEEQGGRAEELGGEAERRS